MTPKLLSTITALLAMILIAILVGIALLVLRTDGAILAGGVAAIAGLGGYVTRMAQETTKKTEASTEK